MVYSPFLFLGRVSYSALPGSNASLCRSATGSIFDHRGAKW